MLDLIIHDETTAPEAARPALAATKKLFGFIPNLTGAMADAPSVLEGYAALGKAFGETSLSPVEREVVTLTVSFHNGCVYCMSGHSMLASMARMEAGDLEALRTGGSMPTSRLEALRVFTKKLLENRGRITDADLDAFLGAGYTRRQAMEVPLGIAFKTLSNFSHRLQPVPVDKAVEPHLWSPSTESNGRKLLISGWVRPEGKAVLPEYQAGAGPIMGKHGGRPLLKSQPRTFHVGQGPDLVVLMEFPSADAAAAAFADPDYQKLLDLRDQAFSRLEVTDLGAGV